VEVKGTSQARAIVELTPNEYSASKLHVAEYGVVNVTNVLRPALLVREFLFDLNSEEWINPEGHRLQRRDIVGLRLSD
jgi:hypothetical protein